MQVQRDYSKEKIERTNFSENLIRLDKWLLGYLINFIVWSLLLKFVLLI